MIINLIKAETRDLMVIEELLKRNNLPYQDIKLINVDLFLAYENSLFIGIIGLEKFGEVGLLRSMAVKQEYRNKGYGTEICKTLMEYAKSEQISELYLLTCTAKEFFERNGFKVIERSTVPDKIKNTTEFSSLCPATAICLRASFN